MQSSVKDRETRVFDEVRRWMPWVCGNTSLGSQLPVILPTLPRFSFREYRPDVFRDVRQAYGVHPRSYRASLAGPMLAETIAAANRPPGPGIPDLLLVGSEDASGKSSAYFYFTRDQRYVIKLCTPQERDIMLEILTDYSQYVSLPKFCQACSLSYDRTTAFVRGSRVKEAARAADEFGGGRPHSFLPQIYGMYTVKMDAVYSEPGQQGKQINAAVKNHWIVMANVIATKLRIEYKFDLKGSTYKRDASQSEIAKGSGIHPAFRGLKCHQSAEPHISAVGAVLKDNDFTKVMKQAGRRDILYAPSGFASEQIQAIFDRDVEFLSRNRLIDYSLLLGVHLLPPVQYSRSLTNNSNNVALVRDWRG
eukprot:SAG31_NODE_3908_length_3763_cov_2.736627_2_plen_364_part_00